jgi:Flp pilus assembly pilin Flp
VLATPEMRVRSSIRRDDGGQDLAEYGIALSVVGVVAIAAALAIGTDIGSIWDPVESSIDNITHGHHGHHGNGNGNGHGNGNGNGNGNGP